ncbi:MAG: alpha/beta hydrolase [Cytophagales bacterium]|nr:MAG: alpha/beta hydrolase [Cytophagales bacterium]
MPIINANGANLHYEITGNGKEIIVFSHGLLWSGEMFAEQVKYFQDRYTCITYDHRGQGKSEVTPTGYDMETVYQDAVALIEGLKIAPCHFAGLSMGGFVGMRIAARRPDLLKSVILMETTADAEPFAFKYKILNTIVGLFGVKSVTSKVMPIMFGKTFMTDSSRSKLRKEWTEKLQSNKKTITKAVTGVITRQSVFDEVSKINVPTLILVGDEDVATVPEKSQRLHSQIKNSKFILIKNAGHSSSVEEPMQINKAIENFLANY